MRRLISPGAVVVALVLMVMALPGIAMAQMGGMGGMGGLGSGQLSPPSMGVPRLPSPTAGDDLPEGFHPHTAEPPAADETPAGPTGPADTVCRRVTRVRFTGLARVSADDLQDSVHTRVGACLSRAQASRDAHALWDLGFFQDVQVTDTPSEGGVEVRFALSERPSIHAVRFEGFDEVDEDKLRETVDIRDGAVLSEVAVRRNLQKVLDLYAEKGFFLAEVTYRIEHATGENQVDVVFHIVEHEQVQVRSITFIGNTSIPSDDLRGVMATGTAGFFSFLTSSGTFREDAFRNDIDGLHAAYYDRGFLTVEIENPRVALSPDRQFIDIAINIREGPRYRIARLRATEVDDDGNDVEPLGGRRALREMLHAQSGEYFSRTVIGHDIVGLQTYYRDAGYANVEVTPDIQPHPDRQTVDLGVRIVRGPLVYVHRIEVRGNAKTSDRVIRREMQLFEGERYSETLYQASRRRVMALGYFERVDLSTEPVEGHPDWLVVNVEVAERPTGTFQVGAGFSSVENFIFTAQIQQLNLFGRGQSLTLQAQLSGLRQIFSLRLVEPYFFDSNWTFAADLYNTLTAFTSFTRTATGGTLTFGYPLFGNNELHLFATYTGEEVSVTTAATAGIFGQTTIQTFFQSLPLANLLRSGFTSAAGMSMAYDSRDNRLFPTSGIYARIGVDFADPILLSENTYSRVSGWFRYYHPVFAGIVFKANFQGGVVTSRTDQGVPIFERYFLGGIFDVRGFALRSISPRLTLPTARDPNATLVPTGAEIGGNVEAYYNIEFEFPILASVGIKGVIFHDAGNVFNTEQQYCQAHGTPQAVAIDPCTSFLSNPLALRYSVGFGLRWQSPLGLLRFEWGFPLNRLTYENPSDFEFTIGNFF